MCTASTPSKRRLTRMRLMRISMRVKPVERCENRLLRGELAAESVPSPPRFLWRRGLGRGGAFKEVLLKKMPPLPCPLLHKKRGGEGALSAASFSSQHPLSL
jgi:hypothetical protein